MDIEIARNSDEAGPTPVDHGHACGCGEVDGPGYPELDARVIPHAIRHATIFGALDSVGAGSGLVLVAPHDPLPLLAQLERRAPGSYSVEYLERGPEAWRLRLVREVFADQPAVVVEPLKAGLIADYAADRDAVALVKGLRNGADYDYELPMATMNRTLTGVETVFVPGEPSLLHLSSTLVMEVHGLDGDVSNFVPPQVLEAIKGRDRAA